MDKNSKNSLYRYEIDGLRAIAVLAVIINHFNKDILPSGYLGVDIFFVISGYVITASLVRRENKSFSDYIISFYERRIKRIIPLLTIFVVITSIIICIFNPFPIFNLRTGFASLFGLSNILLFKSSDGYFTPSSNLNPFTHTWSLSVEEQFYLFYPLLVWFTGYSRNKKNSFLFLSIILLILSIASLSLFVYYYPKNQNAAYFLMPNRFWEMSAGCLTFIAISKKIKIIEYVKNLNSNFIFILLISSLFIPLKSAIVATIAVVLLTSLAIIALKFEDFIYGFLTNKYILKIGLLSYSLYLWHWGIISLSEWTIGIYWWTIPFQGIAIFYISLLSFNFIEKPLRNYDYKGQLKTFFYGITLIFFGQATILYLGISGKRLLYSGNIQGIYNRDLSSRTIFFNECNLSRNSFEKVVSIQNCSYTMDSLKKRIFIIGDSHANMFFNAFKTISKDNYVLSNFTGNACSFPVLEDNDFNIGKICSSQMKNVEKFIQENIKSGDIIFVGNSKLNREILNLYLGKDINEINIKLKNYFYRLNTFSKIISKKGGSIYYLVDGPTFQGVSDAYCSTEWFRPRRFVKKECYQNRSKFEEPRNKVINYFLKNNNDINLIHNYLDFICDKNICNASGYIDSNHIIEDLSFKILVDKVTRDEEIGNKLLE